MAIYTYDEAERIIEVFDDILCQYNIFVPSPEDTDEFNNKVVGFHGSIYKDLLNKVEENLVDVLKRHKTDTDVIINQFSETNEIENNEMSDLIEQLKMLFEQHDDYNIFVSTNKSYKYTVYTNEQGNEITAFSIEYFKNNKNKNSNNTDTKLMERIILRYFNCYSGICKLCLNSFQSILDFIISNNVIYSASIQKGIEGVEDILYIPVSKNKYMELIFNNDDLLTEINISNTPIDELYRYNKKYLLESNICAEFILGSLIYHE